MNNKPETLWSLDFILNFRNCDIEFGEKTIKNIGQSLGELIDPGGEIIGIVNNFGEHCEDMNGLRFFHETQNCLITGHFVFKTKNIYLNIHSCAAYKPSVVLAKATELMKPKDYTAQKVYRE